MIFNFLTIFSSDAATNKDESYDPTDDPRRLRPGEIDPNPEAKPARPDRVDLEEDEKEMLQEARARLANTKGKKAKRKAREKQLEEARRLAAVQKRRELKAAGISVAPQPTRKKKNKSGMDYNKEIPFLHRPAAGFHSTEREHERERLLTLDPTFNHLTLQKLEGERRDDVEENARQKDVDKLKKRLAKETPDVLDQMQKKAEKHQRKSKLVMPAPQMADEEVREIAKMSYEPEQDEEEANEATRELLSRYDATPRSSSSSAAGVPMTPSIRGGEARTPLRPNTIMNEAQNLIAITTASTPLLGGDNVPLHPTDFSSALPKRRDIMTPNPLATPSVHQSTFFCS